MSAPFGSGVLYSEMSPPARREDAFNRWYDDAHVPSRLAVPGFTGARRYRADESGLYLAVYEMTNTDVLASEAYRRLKAAPGSETAEMLNAVGHFCRYVATETERSPFHMPANAEWLYSVFFQVPPEREAAFDSWYVEDHIPTLLEDPSWLGARRLRISAGEPEPWTHLALHYLAGPEALRSEARQRARASSRREALASESWFRPRYRVFRLLPTYTVETDSEAGARDT